MGWRQGKGIGAAAPLPEAGGPSSSSGGRKSGRWGRDAGLGAENTPIFALEAKNDTDGLGFDPFKVQLDPSGCRQLHAVLNHANNTSCFDCCLPSVADLLTRE